jgi:hypothetical protein
MLGEERRAILEGVVACFRLRLWCRSCTGKRIRALPPSRNWQSIEADVRVVFDDLLLSGRSLTPAIVLAVNFVGQLAGRIPEG